MYIHCFHNGVAYDHFSTIAYNSSILIIRHVILVAIIGTTILAPYHLVKSLQPIQRLGARRFHLQAPNLRKSCSGLTSMRGYQDISSNNIFDQAHGICYTRTCSTSSQPPLIEQIT